MEIKPGKLCCDMWIVLSQQLIGGGVVLGTLAIVDELGNWALAVGIILYVLGIVMGQSLVRERKIGDGRGAEDICR